MYDLQDPQPQQEPPKPPPHPAPPQEQSTFMRMYIGGDSAPPMGGVVRLGVRQDAGRSARIVAAAVKTGLPEDLIDRNLDEIEQITREQGFDAESFRRSSPKLAQWISESPYAAGTVFGDERGAEWLAKAGKLEKLLTLKPSQWPKSHKFLLAKAQRKVDQLSNLDLIMYERERAKLNNEQFEEVPSSVLQFADAPDTMEEFFGPKNQHDITQMKGRVDVLNKRMEKWREKARQRIFFRLQEIEEFIASEDEIGAREAFLRSDPLAMFGLGFLTDLNYYPKLIDAAMAMNEGRADENQADLLEEFQRVAEAEERRGKSVWGYVAEIVPQLPSHIVAFASTMGAYHGVKELIVRGGKAAAEHELKKGLAALATRGARHVAGHTAGVLAHTVARTTPGIIAGTQRERLMSILAGGDDDFLPAFMKSFGKASVETFSEYAGAPIGKVMSGLKGAIMRRWIGASVGRTEASFMAKLSEKAGWHGVFGELFEERVSEYGQQKIEGEHLLSYKPPSLKQIAAEAMSFTMISGPGMAADVMAPKMPVEAKIAEAEETEDAIASVNEVVQAIHETQKTPEVVAQALDRVTKDAQVEYVFVPLQAWNEYWQNQKDAAGAQVDPRAKAIELIGSAKPYDAAQRTGEKSLLQIPFQRYTASTAPVEHAPFFEQNGLFRPQGLTATEAKEEAKKLQEAAKAAATTPEGKERERARGEIFESFRQQLLAAGVPAIEAEAGARIESARASMRGVVRGEDPLDVMRRRQFEIQKVDEVKAGEAGHEEDSIERSVVDGGPVFREFKDKTQDAIEALKAAGAGEAVDALHHPEVGHFDLIYGAAKRTKGQSYGLAKLLKWHPEVLGDLQGFINTLKKDQERSTGNTIQLSSPDGRAGIRLDYFGTPKRWLVTAFRLDKKGPASPSTTIDIAERPQEGGQRDDTARPPQVGPDPTIPPSDFESDAKAHEESARQGQQGPRGRLIPQARRFLMQLTKWRDVSTVPHELAHAWLEEIREDVPFLLQKDPATLNAVQKRFLKGAEDLRKYLGIESWDKPVTKVQSEKFARTNEKYLMTGVAPSPELRTVFFRFGQWLLNLYKEMLDYFQGIQLTPEVRDFMDRLLATEEEIAAARAENKIRPLFDNLQAIGMNEDQTEEYIALLEEAHREGFEGLAKETTEVLRRRQEALWAEERERIRTQLSKEIDKRPEYITLSILAKGETPTGEDVAWARGGVRFSRETMEVRFPEHWPSLRIEPFVTRDGKDDPDVVAEFLQYGSADQFFKVLKNTEPREELLDRMADDRMNELHPELLLDPEALRQAATDHILNDKQQLLHRRELEYLKSEHFAKFKGLIQQITGNIPTTDELKDEAQQLIQLKTARELDPAIFERQAAQSADEARDALLRGDWQGAFDAKRTQMLNIAFYREAAKVREQLRKIVSYMKKIGRDSKLRALGRAGHDYLERIEDILEQYDFMPASERTIEKRKSFKEWYAEQLKAGETPIVPEKIIAQAAKSHWKDVPVRELVEVYNAARNIAHLAQTKNKLLSAVRKREFEETIEDATGSIRKTFEGKKPKTEPIGEESPGESFARKMAEWGAGLRKFSSLAQELDGFKNGMVWETLVVPLNHAQEREQDMIQSAAKRLDSIFSVYSRKERRRMHRRIHVADVGVNLTRWDIVGIAAHWGSEGNRERVMADYGWTEAQVLGVIGHLNERDFKVVQDLTDFINEYWPETKELAKEFDGIAPEKVEALGYEITSADGKQVKMKGGYWPVRRKQDPSKPHMSIDELVEASIRGTAFRATTRHGHREARTGLGGGATRIDMAVLTEHLRDVVHDLTHYRWLRDANKLLRDPRMMKAIKETLGPSGYQEMLDTVKAVAVNNRQQVQGVDKFVEWVTRKTRASVLAFNVKTIVKQYFGFTATVELLGPEYALKGVRAAGFGLENLQNVEEFIQRNSLFMKGRRNSFSREQLEVFGELKGLDLAAPAVAVLREMERLGFLGIGWTQWHVDKATWLGAYQKYAADLGLEKVASAHERKELEERIFSMADQAVRDTQGSGLLADMPAALRARGTMRAFTVFKTFSINLLNRYIQRAREFNKDRNAASAARLGLLFFETIVVPAIVWDIMRSLVTGGGDDDDETLAGRMFRKGVVGGAQDLAWSVPVFGEGLDIGIDAFQGRPFDYEGPQGLSVMNDFIGLMRQAGQGEVDRALLRSTLRLGGDLGLPGTRQLESTIFGFLDWQDEEAGPGSLLLGPPPKN